MAPFAAGSKPHTGPAPAPPSPSVEASASFLSGSSSVSTSQAPASQFMFPIPNGWTPRLRYTLPRLPVLQPQFTVACTDLLLGLTQVPVFLLATPAPPPKRLLCVRAADAGGQGAVLLRPLHMERAPLSPHSHSPSQDGPRSHLSHFPRAQPLPSSTVAFCGSCTATEQSMYLGGKWLALGAGLAS